MQEIHESVENINRNLFLLPNSLELQEIIESAKEKIASFEAEIHNIRKMLE